MIVNTFLIITLDISRFTGNYFFEYKYFLYRAYGIFIIGLIPVFASIILAILSFIKGFKFFSFKNILKDNFNPISYRLFYMVGILFFHLLSLQVHEDRYTIIFFAVPYILLGYFLYNLLISLKEGNNKKIKILLILFIICILIAPYISLSHFYHERYPYYENKIRLIPSLIYYEDIKSALIQDILNELVTKSNSGNFDHFIDKDFIVEKLKLNSILNYPFLANILLGKIDQSKLDIYNQIKNSKVKYFISTENIYLEKDRARQRQILSCISRFVNINTNLVIDNNQLEKFLFENRDKKEGEDKFKIYKIVFYQKTNKIPENYQIIGYLPNAILTKELIE